MLRQFLQMTNPGEAGALLRETLRSSGVIVTDEYAAVPLTQLSRESLAKVDAELLEAAISVAHDIRRQPAVVTRSRSSEQSAVENERLRALSSIGTETIERARALAASVDALLSGGAR